MQEKYTERNYETWGLIGGRHDLPVDKYIFDGAIEEPRDIHKMQETIQKKLAGYKTMGGLLYLYMTGFSTAMVEVIRWAIVHQVDLIIYQYDSKAKEYYAQEVGTTFWLDEVRGSL